MNDADPAVDEGNEREFQALAESLHVPTLKVVEVYKTEYVRLATQARIATYVSVLAMRNTRSILRGAGSVQ